MTTTSANVAGVPKPFAMTKRAWPCGCYNSGLVTTAELYRKGPSALKCKCKHTTEDINEGKSVQVGPDEWELDGVRGKWRQTGGSPRFYPNKGGGPIPKLPSDGKKGGWLKRLIGAFSSKKGTMTSTPKESPKGGGGQAAPKSGGGKKGGGKKKNETPKEKSREEKKADMLVKISDMLKKAKEKKNGPAARILKQMQKALLKDDLVAFAKAEKAMSKLVKKMQKKG